MGAVDNRLLDILDKAATDFPYEVRVRSGFRDGDKRFHGHGMAMDITLHDPQTGAKIPDYQDANSFRVYEQFAQRARQVQQQHYPDLERNFRWGGYFSGGPGKYGAADLMHFDLGGSDRLGMAGGSWDGGLSQQQRAYFPGAKSQGMNSTQGQAMAYAGASPKMSDDDILSVFTKGAGAPKGEAKPAAASAASQGLSDDDLIAAFTGGGKAAEGKPAQAQAQEPAKPVEAGAAKPSPITANDAVRSIATGVPIVGGVLNKANAAINATLAPVGNKFFDPADQLQGGSWGERYQNSLTQQNAMDARFAQEHPVANTVGNIAGGVIGTLPAMTAAPAAFGLSRTAGLTANSIMAAGSGATIGAADSAVRSGGDFDVTKGGALTGGLFGAAAPSVGKLIGMGANKLLDAASRTSSAARNVGNVLTEAGMTPQEAQSALARLGPDAMLADINPALRAEAGALASMGGKPTSVLKSAMQERANGSAGRIADAIDEALGPRGDAQAMLAEIRARASGAGQTASSASGVADSFMGKVKDPYEAMQTMLKSRSAAAEPLYEKALSQPVVWDTRLQSFLDDGIVKAGLAKGVKIQRLEALADGKPFKPSDYAITDFTQGGEPVISAVPNMRTLNVVKKGLDSLVGDARDAVTGRLSEEGRAIDKVRSAFLDKLDAINPDYAAARKAWAGPTQAHEAFTRGMEIFTNRAGQPGVNRTPGAFKSWVSTASEAELEAARFGARAAIDQAMSTAADPAAAAAAKVSLGANQQKLEALFGKETTNKLVAHLNYSFDDPAASAFSKGLDLFKNRTGEIGVGDTPDAFRSWAASAGRTELEAARVGARESINMAVASARQGDYSALRGLFAKSSANREKLETLFPDAKKLFDRLSSEMSMRATEGHVAQGSQTAERQAIQAKYSLKPEGHLSAGKFLVGESIAPGGGGTALAVADSAFAQIRNEIAMASRNRLIEGTAKGLSATGDAQKQFMNELFRAVGTQRASDAITTGTQRVGNALTRSIGQDYRNRLLDAR
jgi:hypothetical protein